ncbi:hypothetical protein BDY19DRAFT_985163 [Irpex rosettiformis]|uniref:Uncharacterized protein n=1 Tax=Irpex rosettiformis TaxID=378272 RepID=A0ACB8U518_9APHY|nr:hypothetical protein BDY19DRAFT_985163 [Irpex rosettiformis]
MSDTDALDLELQQALEEAFGAPTPPKVKKTKKRDRVTQDGDQSQEMKKKRKRKKKTADEEGDTHVEGLVEDVVVPEAASKEAKKRKKKDKGKQRVETVQEDIQVNPPPITPPAVQQTPHDDFAASSAEFLSAVVAAASADSHMHAGPSNQFVPPVPPYHDPMVPYHPPTSEFHPFPPPMYPPGPDGVTMPDLSMIPSEYLMQTLQNLDFSQLASVLKTLGDNGAGTVLPSLNISPSFVPGPQPPGPPPVKQTSAKSVSILGRHPKQVKESGQSTRSLPPPSVSPPAVNADEGNPDHAYMLANVWMNANKLSQMTKTHGLVFKKGKFSATEEVQLNSAIERYKSEKGITQHDLVELVFSKERGRGETFWQEITSALHARPIIAVYHHVRRKLDPLSNLGKWMASEDESLRSAVQEFSQQWQKVSERVGRSASDCRDRYRNHLENSSSRRSGAWTKEEEEELTAIVNELKMQRGEVSDNDIFWGAVSQRMGGRRGRQQCRIKWLDSLCPKLKNDGMKPRWSQLDAYILVHKVDSLSVRDDSEIDWKTLPDEDWNTWSAHALQRRWLTMKRSVKGHEEMSHAELMDILRTKKAQSPPPPSSHRGSKKIPISSEMIEDSDDESGSNAEPTTQQDGSEEGQTSM